MTTLYDQHEDGSYAFKPERRAWGVDIPAYVYDLWMPLLGLEVIGVYGVYWRLARNGQFKGISTAKLAKLCRMAKSTLLDANETLQSCGFIQVKQPAKRERLMHYTNMVTVYDPPAVVSQEAINQYGPRDKEGNLEYEPLTPWLVDAWSPAEPPEVNTEPPAVPRATAKIDPSFVDPSLSSDKRSTGPGRGSLFSRVPQVQRDAKPVPQDPNKIPYEALPPIGKLVLELLEGKAKTLSQAQLNRLEQKTVSIKLKQDGLPSPAEMFSRYPQAFQDWASTLPLHSYVQGHKKSVTSIIDVMCKPDFDGGWAHLIKTVPSPDNRSPDAFGAPTGVE